MCSGQEGQMNALDSVKKYILVTNLSVCYLGTCIELESSEQSYMAEL
jgi:hypothetical protein